jgi:hypothetical protein
MEKVMLQVTQEELAVIIDALQWHMAIHQEVSRDEVAHETRVLLERLEQEYRDLYADA